MLTALSLSALATNMKIGGGGAYFIISRSLGLEPGAAIGIPLFLAQALGVSFYTAGFAEAVGWVFPGLPPTTTGIVTLVVLSVLAWSSADLALKSQFFVMAAIGLSLVSFFAGGPVTSSGSGNLSEISASPGFWAAFAVFFPAVSGIEAGISMSGDLKNPARALPLGTLAAVTTGLLVYLAIPIHLDAMVQDKTLLLTRPLIMRDVARFGGLIILGVWGASLSSAMGSLLGAPRTLQALARDGVMPGFLGKGFGKGNNPRIATLLVFCIALGGILAGDINFIAPILTMFFLTSYGFLNFSAGLESLVGSPTWRPQFKVPWVLSIIASAACLAAMLMINAGATILAVLACGAIYFLQKRRRMQAKWGDLRSGILMLLARFSLYRLADREADERSWKPNILVLSGLPTQRWYLVDFAEAIAGKSCLVTVAMVLPEDSGDERAQSAQDVLRDYLRRHHVNALVKTVTAGDPYRGGRDLINTYGFGPMVPNTILVGASREESRFTHYAELIMQAGRRRRNVVIVLEGPPLRPGEKPGRMDVWWRGRGQNAGFMLALAHLIGKGPGWKGAQLRINTAVNDEVEREGMDRHLKAFLHNSRLNAEYRIHSLDGAAPLETVRLRSSDAGLVFLGMRPPAPGEDPESYGAYYGGLIRNTDGLPLTAMVLANETVDFQSIFSG